MVDLGIMITFLVFVSVLLFGVGFYLYVERLRERSKFLKRIQQVGTDPVLQKGSVFEEMKKQWVGFIISLGNVVKPKSEREVSYLRKMFLRAGYRGENASIIFWGVKALLAILAALLFLSIRLLVAKHMSPFYLTSFTVLIALIGFHVPNLWLRVKIETRKETIRAGLPDALDLMVVCVEAGGGLDAAINRVAEEMKLSNRPISEDFKLLGLELRAGKSREDALRNLAFRADLEDMESLVTLLVQTERFGTSIAQALRVHSDFMRTKRFQKAEEVAAKLPVKLMFPLVMFILPSLFVVVLGPAAITIFRTLLPRLGGQ